jgi:hypothetical protein
LGPGCCAWRCSAGKVRQRTLACTIQKALLTPFFFHPLLRHVREHALIGIWSPCLVMIVRQGIEQPAETFFSDPDAPAIEILLFRIGSSAVC